MIVLTQSNHGSELDDMYWEYLLSQSFTKVKVALRGGHADENDCSWMYLVENTVEKSIYDISANRRLALMGQAAVRETIKDDNDLEQRIEAANTLELEQTPLATLLTKGSAGGEVVAKEDLWDCLFRRQPGQKREEAEFEMTRHLGATAAESRRDTNDQVMIDATSSG